MYTKFKVANNRKFLNQKETDPNGHVHTNPGS